jgi:hypothetical protein
MDSTPNLDQMLSVSAYVMWGKYFAPHFFYALISTILLAMLE